MKLETNADYNPVQLNETINFSPNGTILSKSVMINIRNESPKKVWKLYQELKKLIGGKAEIKEEKPEVKSKKKVKNNPGSTKEERQKKEKKEEEKNNPGKCPRCGGMLIEKSGISSKNGRPYHFYGCSNWPICNYTKPFESKDEKERLLNEPCDEDLMIEQR